MGERGQLERAFGVLKKSFPLLVLMREYDYELQVKLVVVCALILNFIILNNDKDEYLQEDNTETLMRDTELTTTTRKRMKLGGMG